MRVVRPAGVVRAADGILNFISCTPTNEGIL